MIFEGLYCHSTLNVGFKLRASSVIEKDIHEYFEHVFILIHLFLYSQKRTHTVA